MRFSLATLLLLVLLAASLMAVWVRRESWYRVQRDFSTDELKMEFPNEPTSGEVSPDGTRTLTFFHDGSPGEGFISIHDGNSQAEILYSLRTMPFGRFLSDDAIAMTTPFEKDVSSLFRRRFPEWWWGHFYRLEVWASLALSVALIFRAIRARRRKAIGSVQQ